MKDRKTKPSTPPELLIAKIAKWNIRSMATFSRQLKAYILDPYERE